MRNKIISSNSLHFFILRMKFVTLYWLHHWFAPFNGLVYCIVLKFWFLWFFFSYLICSPIHISSWKKFLSILTKKKTYFFYFTYSLFKTSHVRLSTLHYIFFLILIFLDFFSSFYFFTNNNHHLLSPFILGIRKEKVKS